MSKGKSGPKKDVTYGLRWPAEVINRWELIAEELNMPSSVLARQVLEEFLSCFLTDDELKALGLVRLEGKRPGGLITHAMKKAERLESGFHQGKKKPA